MVVANLTDIIYAGNRRVQQFTVTDEDSVGSPAYDLTGLIVKYALARFSNGAPLKDDPLLDFATTDGSPQVVITVAASGIIEVTLLPADTSGLQPDDYYFELEVFNAAGDEGVVVATGTLTVRTNVENA